MAYIGKTLEPSFYYFADQATAEFAKSLRKRMTPCEKILWQRLRNHGRIWNKSTAVHQ